MERKAENGGELYFELAHELSPTINKHIQDKIKGLNLPGKLESLLLELPKKREKKIVMRPTLSYLIYRNLGGEKNYFELLPLLVVSELSNYFAYLDNWILDNKNNCKGDISKIRNLTIASQILRELTQECIEETDISDEVKREISLRLTKATEGCYEGQFRDLEMTVEKVDDFETDDTYTKEYLKKSKLQSGSLYGLSGAIGAIAAVSDKETIKNFEEFASLFGTSLHVSNDLGDFAIFNGNNGSFKPYQDQLADIINGRLSLPIYYVLKYGSPSEKEALKKLVGNSEASIEEKMGASKSILSSGAYQRTKEILNKFRNNLKRKVKEFPENIFKYALSSMISTITHNKYLNDLKNMQGCINDSKN